MPFISGKDAAFTFTTGYSVGATSWTMEVDAEEVTTTALGDEWRTLIGGVKGWRGTYTCLIDSTNMPGTWQTGAGNIGFPVGAQAAAAVFTLDASPAATFSGSIVVIGLNTEATVESGAGTFVMNYVGSGTLTPNT